MQSKIAIILIIQLIVSIGCYVLLFQVNPYLLLAIAGLRLVDASDIYIKSLINKK